MRHLSLLLSWYIIAALPYGSQGADVADRDLIHGFVHVRWSQNGKAQDVYVEKDLNVKEVLQVDAYHGTTVGLRKNGDDVVALTTEGIEAKSTLSALYEEKKSEGLQPVVTKKSQLDRLDTNTLFWVWNDKKKNFTLYKKTSGKRAKDVNTLVMPPPMTEAEEQAFQENIRQAVEKMPTEEEFQAIFDQIPMPADPEGEPAPVEEERRNDPKKDPLQEKNWKRRWVAAHNISVSIAAVCTGLYLVYRAYRLPNLNGKPIDTVKKAQAPAGQRPASPPPPRGRRPDVPPARPRRRR